MSLELLVMRTVLDVAIVLLLGAVRKSNSKAARENGEEDDGPDHLLRQVCHTRMELSRRSKR